jgi:septal ring factor EnvC (AmiA/AmiB activator)
MTLNLPVICQFLYKEQFENIVIGASVVLCYIAHKAFSSSVPTRNIDNQTEQLRKQIHIQKKRYNDLLTKLDDVESRVADMRTRLETDAI